MKILHFFVLYGVVTVFAQASAKISNCSCSCEEFSEAQGKQLRGLLQQEASMLREGMQRMCPKKDGKSYYSEVLLAIEKKKPSKSAMGYLPRNAVSDNFFLEPSKLNEEN